MDSQEKVISGASADPSHDVEQGISTKRIELPAGYEKLAAFMVDTNNDENLVLFRKFDSLNVRVLLEMQLKLAKTEQELRVLDESTTRSLDPTVARKQEKILQQLQSLMKEYNDFINAYAATKSLSPAHARQTGKVQAWLKMHPGHTIDDDALGYAMHTNELVSLVPRPRTRSRFLSDHFPALFRMFNGHHEPGPEATNNAVVLNFLRLAVIATGLIMIYGPLWGMYFMDSQLHRLIVVSAFIGVFAIFVFLATAGRPYEVLVITAGHGIALSTLMTGTR